MFDYGPTTLPSLGGKRSPSLSGSQHLGSFHSQNPQAFAPSNALCALRHSQQTAVFQSETPGCLHSEDGFYGSHVPSSIDSSQNIAWRGRQTWAGPSFASAVPYPEEPWKFGSLRNSELENPCSQYPVMSSGNSQDYSVATMVPFSRDDHQPLSAIGQHQIPPSEPVPANFFSSSAPPPPIKQPPRSSTAFGSNLEYEDVTDSITMMQHTKDQDEKIGEIPYAKLIERALLDAKGNRLVLKDIYKWIEQNTEKASNPAVKGWQNSVRHNLSMNGAFTKIPLPPSSNKSRKGYMWLLEPSAKEHGIQSTTRYRLKDETKRIGKRPTPNVRRQRSGRRGGCASQKSAKLRKREDSQSPQYLKDEHPPSSHRYDFDSQEHQHLAPHVSGSATYHQPYLPSPPSSSQYSLPEKCGYDHPESYPYVPLESGSLLARRSDHNTDQMFLSCAETGIANHLIGGQLGSYL